MLKEPELDPAALKAAKKAQRKLRKRSAREEEDDDAPAAKRTETEEVRTHAIILGPIKRRNASDIF